MRASLPLVCVAGLFAAACGSSATTNVTSVAGPSATPARCAVTLTTPTSSFGPGGGTSSVNVSTERECAWTASPQSPWIEITAGKDGSGNGTVAYRVRENVDPVTRSGAIVINDQRAAISQGAAPCRFDVSPATAVLDAAGGEATINVRTNAVCAWSAGADATWVHVNPSAATGNGTVTVVATPNPGPERSVTLKVAQSQLLLRQGAPAPEPAPVPAPTPTPAPPPPSPGPTPSPGPAPEPSPAPSPAPPPTPGPEPPPPPPTPTTVEFGGEVKELDGSCPEIRFDVKNRTVVTNGDTAYKKGDCTDVREDRKVDVTGQLLSNGLVLAQSVEIHKQ